MDSKQLSNCFTNINYQYPVFDSIQHLSIPYTSKHYEVLRFLKKELASISIFHEKELSIIFKCWDANVFPLVIELFLNMLFQCVKIENLQLFHDLKLSSFIKDNTNLTYQHILEKQPSFIPHNTYKCIFRSKLNTDAKPFEFSSQFLREQEKKASTATAVTSTKFNPNALEFTSISGTTSSKTGSHKQKAHTLESFVEKTIDLSISDDIKLSQKSSSKYSIINMNSEFKNHIQSIVKHQLILYSKLQDTIRIGLASLQYDSSLVQDFSHAIKFFGLNQFISIIPNNNNICVLEFQCNQPIVKVRNFVYESKTLMYLSLQTQDYEKKKSLLLSQQLDVYLSQRQFVTHVFKELNFTMPDNMDRHAFTDLYNTHIRLLWMAINNIFSSLEYQMSEYQHVLQKSQTERIEYISSHKRFLHDNFIEFSQAELELIVIVWKAILTLESQVKHYKFGSEFSLFSTQFQLKSMSPSSSLKLLNIIDMIKV